MKITILCVGKIKEKFYQDAVAEYAKRLFAYCKLEIVEVADEKTIEGKEKAAVEKEGARLAERLAERISENTYVAALCIDGRSRSSEQMSAWMGDLMNHGISHLIFIIGGSCGLADAIVKKANERISFSALTFPHQLMRVILLEQVYRSFRIMKGEPYHK